MRYSVFYRYAMFYKAISIFPSGVLYSAFRWRWLKLAIQPFSVKDGPSHSHPTIKNDALAWPSGYSAGTPPHVSAAVYANPAVPEIFTLIGFLPVSLRRCLNGEKGELRLPSLFQNPVSM